MSSHEPATPGPDPDAAALRAAIDAARSGLVDRDVLVEVIVLAAVAGEHVLVVGPPGTAKSDAVRRVAQQIGGGYFEYLLGRYTEPNEIFGPVDIRRLRDGVVEIETAGMLPEAEVAFLDEVFLGSTAILNTLLGILNERTFRRGSTIVQCPLRLCVGASNQLPDDPALAAFADRFLVRVFVDSISDTRLDDLLEVGWTRNGNGSGAEPVATMATLDRLSARAASVDLDGVRPVLANAVRRLRAAGMAITDRRAVRAQTLVAAAAALSGRTVATAADLWPLPLVAPTSDAQALARETLADLLASSSSDVLPYAAEELSLGPAARAARLEAAARSLYDALTQQGAVDRDARLRLEALLREIDAGFATADLPPALAPVRQWLVQTIQA